MPYVIVLGAEGWKLVATRLAPKLACPPCALYTEELAAVTAVNNMITIDYAMQVDILAASSPYERSQNWLQLFLEPSLGPAWN